MNDLISRSALIENIAHLGKTEDLTTELKPGAKGIFNAISWHIDQAPAVDAVSGGVFDQVRWERDIAIGQLNDLGISLGCTAPDVVKVVRCKACVYWETEKHIRPFCKHPNGIEVAEETDFCSYGERKDNDT